MSCVSTGIDYFAGMMEWPEKFLERMNVLLKEDYAPFLNSLSAPAPVSIRFNPFKPSDAFRDSEMVSWCPEGRYLKERPAFIFDPLFHAGCYYVQEASSMFLGRAYRQLFPESAPALVLDLCAAPGGKSTHTISLLPAESLLVSNEMIPKRNAILRLNLVKWGTSNVIVTQNKPEDFAALGPVFDFVIVDAPCSGEGLFRRDPAAAEEWSESAVESCALRQKDILLQASRCLKQGGILLYSTCTFEPEEDETQIRVLLDSGEFESVELEPGTTALVKSKDGLRFYPHRIQGEGFFIAALKKIRSEEHNIPKFKTHRLPGMAAESRHLFLNHRYFVQALVEDRLYAIPEVHASAFTYFSQHLFVRHSGVFAGTLKGKDFIPSHDLALSLSCSKELPGIDLSATDALRFLKGDVFQVPAESRGWTLVRYQGHNLGWVKLMQGRMNNYLPKEWRIVKDLPGDILTR